MVGFICYLIYTMGGNATKIMLAHYHYLLCHATNYSSYTLIYLVCPFIPFNNLYRDSHECQTILLGKWGSAAQILFCIVMHLNSLHFSLLHSFYIVYTATYNQSFCEVSGKVLHKFCFALLCILVHNTYVGCTRSTLFLQPRTTNHFAR